MLKKGIDVIVLLFDNTLCILMLDFFILSRFPPFTVTSQGEDDDLLVYTISSPTPAPVLVKPPITQVYSRR